MTGFNPNKPFFENDWTVALTVVPGALLYFSFILFPVFRGEWAWETHGTGNLFATGILLAVVAVPIWKVYSETRKNAWKYLALALTCLSFVGIGGPAFFMAY